MRPHRDRDDINDQRDRDESAEPIEANDPIENIDRNEPADPTERIDPTDPIERIDPFEPIDSRESSDQSDQRDREASIRRVSHWLPGAANSSLGLRAEIARTLSYSASAARASVVRCSVSCMTEA
jgi:hypothetical protein